MDSVRRIEKVVADLEVDVDSFPVGAARVHDTASLESEITELQTKILCARADALLLLALTDFARNSNANEGKTDDTHIAKYENDLVDDTSAINVQQNLAGFADESAAILEALEMEPEEMERLSSSCRSLVRRIKDIVPKCSAAHLELLEIQKDIDEKLKQVQELECVLMKRKSKLADDLVKQRRQLDKKKSSKDAGYDRRKKDVQKIASQINRIKLIIQGLTFISPEILENNACLDILEKTRKPLNLVTYSTEL